MIKNLVYLFPILLFTQNVFVLELDQNIRKIPEFGLNGNTIRGPSWSNLTFNDSVKTMSPKLLRYPGGNVSNYWNWNEGWFHPQSFLDTVLVDTIYTMPNGWSNLNQIDIKLNTFKAALNQINSDGIYVLNMMSSSLENHLEYLQNAMDSGLTFNYIEMGSEFNHENPFSEIKFPTSGDYARTTNLWIDSIKDIIPDVKIGLVAGNRGPEFSRAWNWNDSICEIVNDADALIWHLYLYLQDNDTTYTEKQILGYPFYKVPKYEQWRGFKDTTSLIQDYKIWVTEYNLFDKTSDKRYANTWAHVLFLAGMNDQLLQNQLVDIMIQHNVSGVLPNFDALDIDNLFRKRASGYSSLIWNNQINEMDSIQKIITPTNLIDTTIYLNNNGLVNEVAVPNTFGWKIYNSNEERAIIVNISNDTIPIDAYNILPQSSNWVQWTTDSLFTKIEDGTLLKKDTIFNTNMISLLPYSINIVNSFCYNDMDNDGICDYLEIEGCSEDLTACNYNPLGTQPCIYPEDIYALNYLDCNGFCLNDNDINPTNLNLMGDGICDEVDNCPGVYNPNQLDFNQDGIGDECDGLGLEINNSSRKIVQKFDLLGRDNVTKGFMIYIFDDGTVEKKINK